MLSQVVQKALITSLVVEELLTIDQQLLEGCVSFQVASSRPAHLEVLMHSRHQVCKALSSQQVTSCMLCHGVSSPQCAVPAVVRHPVQPFGKRSATKRVADRVRYEGRSHWSWGDVRNAPPTFTFGRGATFERTLHTCVCVARGGGGANPPPRLLYVSFSRSHAGVW